MRLTLLLSIAASALVTACSSSDSAAPPDGLGSNDASLDGSNDATSTKPTPDSGPTVTNHDGGVEAGSPDAACAAFPGCTSDTSCPEGNGCDLCTCREALWVCSAEGCSDGGTDAGRDAESDGGTDGGSDGGVCPTVLPHVGGACSAAGDLVCLYGTACPTDAFQCVSGEWKAIAIGTGICPP
jgi:hypothetical protein